MTTELADFYADERKFLYACWPQASPWPDIFCWDSPGKVP
jgi:hypothetical protein